MNFKLQHYLRPCLSLLLVIATILGSAATCFAQPAQSTMPELQAFSDVYPQLFNFPDKAQPNQPSTPQNKAIQDPTRQLLLQSYMGETNYYQLSSNLKTNLKPTLRPIHDIQLVLLQQGLSVAEYDNLMQLLANNPQILSQFVDMLRQNRGHIALLQLKQRWPNFANDLPTPAQRVVFRNIIESLQAKQFTTIATRNAFVEKSKPDQTSQPIQVQPVAAYSEYSPQQAVFLESSSSQYLESAQQF